MLYMGGCPITGGHLFFSLIEVDMLEIIVAGIFILKVDFKF